MLLAAALWRLSSGACIPSSTRTPPSYIALHSETDGPHHIDQSDWPGSRLLALEHHIVEAAAASWIEGVT